MDIETRNVDFKDPDFHKKAEMLCAVMKSDIHPTCPLAVDTSVVGNWWRLVASMRWADRIVGHNLIGFDMPIIRATLGDAFTEEQFDDLFMGKVFDTLHELKACHGKRYSLANLALWNGMEPKKFATSENMGELWDTGREYEVIAHCKRDVEIVEGVYNLVRQDKLRLEY